MFIYVHQSLSFLFCEQIAYVFCPFFYYVSCIFLWLGKVLSIFWITITIFFLSYMGCKYLLSIFGFSFYVFIVSFHDQIFLISLWSNLSNFSYDLDFCVLNKRSHKHSPTFSSKSYKCCLSYLRLQSIWNLFHEWILFHGIQFHFSPFESSIFPDIC